MYRQCSRISDDAAAVARWHASAPSWSTSTPIAEAARTIMIVNGFANPVSKELPLEYAVEMNNLIKLEMEGAIG